MNKYSMTLNELLKDSKYNEIRNQMIHSFMEDTKKTYLSLTINELNQKQPTWNSDDLLFGLDRLSREPNTIPFYRIYSNEEISEKPLLNEIGFIHFKAETRKHNYFVLLLSGGAFGSCCNMVEAIPVAARFNELGIDAIVLTYETATMDSFKNGLMPNPLDNISRTLEYIEKHSSIFNLDIKRYVIGGFSAGSYVTATFGLKYKEYNQAKPLSLLLSYPLLSLLDIDNEKMRDLFLTGLYGPMNPTEKEKQFNVFSNLNSDYPPVYTILAKDDETVPKNDPALFVEELEKHHIANHFELINHGGHGFGLGDHADAKGYIERFIKFTGEQNERK